VKAAIEPSTKAPKLIPINSPRAAGTAYFSYHEMPSVFKRAREIGIIAALAGHFGVPVTLVTGDAAAVEEARRLLGEVKYVIAKWGLGRQFALSLSPKKARQLIERAAEEAVRIAASAKPFRVEPPYELSVEYTRAEYADAREHLPGVERLGERAVRVKGHDLIQVFKLVGFC